MTRVVYDVWAMDDTVGVAVVDGDEVAWWCRTPGCQGGYWPRDAERIDGPEDYVISEMYQHFERHHGLPKDWDIDLRLVESRLRVV